MYYFYMGSVLLPIAPEKFTLKVGNSNKTINLINQGEVNLLSEPKLTDLEFDALIPSVQYSFAKYDDGFQSPAYFTSHFEKLKISKEPFQFIITRQMPDGKLIFDTNLTVSMESYTIKEDVKQGFDLLVSFKLKQYKPYGTKIVKVIETPVSTTSPKKEVTTTTKTSRPANSSPSPNKDTTYTAKSGDTLWSIAKKFYGNGEYYKVLFEENSNILINENALTSGQKLKLPSKKSAETTMKKIKNAAGKSSGFTQVDFSATSKAVKP